MAFLCQSEALLANVEQFAAERRVKRTISHALVLPCTVAFLVKTSPIPPAWVRASASMPAVARIYATSLILIRIRHLGMERNSAEAVQTQKTKKPIILAESSADAFDM